MFILEGSWVVGKPSGKVNVLRSTSTKFACSRTTGIACILYGRIPAQTIHSFAGLGQCRGTKEHLLRNVLSNEDCVER